MSYCRVVVAFAFVVTVWREIRERDAAASGPRFALAENGGFPRLRIGNRPKDTLIYDRTSTYLL